MPIFKTKLFFTSYQVLQEYLLTFALWDLIFKYYKCKKVLRVHSMI